MDRTVVHRFWIGVLGWLDVVYLDVERVLV
jgi:hypothetical protein